MLRPWREATAPPISTSVSTSPCRRAPRSTRRRIGRRRGRRRRPARPRSGGRRQPTEMRCASPSSVPQTSVSVVAGAQLDQVVAQRRRCAASGPAGPGGSPPGARRGSAASRTAAAFSACSSGSVGEVQARDVEPASTRRASSRDRGGRADGGDDLGPAHAGHRSAGARGRAVRAVNAPRPGRSVRPLDHAAARGRWSRALAVVPLDADAGEACGQRLAHEHVVDPQAEALVEVAGAVVPPGELLLVGVQAAEGVDAAGRRPRAPAARRARPA